MFAPRIPITDATRVAEVRRVAVATAAREGFGDQAAEEVAIVATEIATNLLKHAKLGEVLISSLSGMAEPGVEVLSIDRGPGIANLAQCIADGFSTVGTAGNGLGAISRLSDVFDAYSQTGQGTVLVARKFLNESRKPRAAAWTFGAASVPYPGETSCGDGLSVRRDGGLIQMLVVDGLGHGILAADAATVAVRAFHIGRTEAPGAMVDTIHRALRSTRGAAVAVCQIEPDGRCARYAGLGNIVGVVLGGARAQFMISHNGTAGLEARRIQEFEYRLPEEATLVMHSDGLTTSWSLDAYPGLVRRHPSVIAGVLYRDASRGRDDASVLVGRHIQE